MHKKVNQQSSNLKQFNKSDYNNLEQTNFFGKLYIGWQTKTNHDSKRKQKHLCLTYSTTQTLEFRTRNPFNGIMETTPKNRRRLEKRVTEFTESLSTMKNQISLPVNIWKQCDQRERSTEHHTTKTTAFRTSTVAQHFGAGSLQN